MEQVLDLNVLLATIVYSVVGIVVFAAAFFTEKIDSITITTQTMIDNLHNPWAMRLSFFKVAFSQVSKNRARLERQPICQL